MMKMVVTTASGHKYEKDIISVTLQQLADKLVCGQNTLYKWLRTGRMPNLEAVMLMAATFNVSIDYLVYGEEQC